MKICEYLVLPTRKLVFHLWLRNLVKFEKLTKFYTVQILIPPLHIKILWMFPKLTMKRDEPYTCGPSNKYGKNIFIIPQNWKKFIDKHINS